jgi:hypothetical protein
MKIKLGTKLVAATGLIMSAGVAQAAYQDVAVNGGFETGDFTGWTLFPGSLGAAGQNVTSVNPSSGTYSGNLTETAAAANIIKQANLLPGAWTEGQLIDIQFDIRGTAAAGGVLFAELFMELDGGGVGPGSGILGGGPLFPNADADVWTTYEFQVAAGPDTSGGITLQFNSACAPIDGCIADYFIDNVLISADVEVPQVPVPAAVWLFGSGLLGLIGVARRRKA